MVFFRLQNGCKNYNFTNEIGWHMNIIIRFEAQTHELFAGKWMKKKRSFVNAQTSLKTPFFLFQLMSCIFASMPLLSLCFLTRAFGFLFRRLYLTKNLVEELCFISEIKVNMCSVKLLFVLIFFSFSDFSFFFVFAHQFADCCLLLFSVFNSFYLAFLQRSALPQTNTHKTFHCNPNGIVILFIHQKKK